MRIQAPAKLNLCLYLGPRRADGLHELCSLFEPLALADSLTVAEGERDEILCPGVEGDPAANLAARALAALREAGWGGPPLRIEVEKRIPVAAGLGGGSADAAMTLLGLARLWDLDVDPPTLSRLAARLGSDVPFFLVGGTALGLGRGDDIYPLADLPRTEVVVVRPTFGVSTVEAYGWYDNEPRRPTREPARRALPDRWPEWARSLKNDLEPPVTRHHPTIARIKHALLDAGAVVAAMSGSGSGVFGLFERPEAARRTAADLSRPGWQVVHTRTLSRAEYGRRIRPVLAGSRRLV